MVNSCLHSGQHIQKNQRSKDPYGKRLSFSFLLKFQFGPNFLKVVNQLMWYFQEINWAYLSSKLPSNQITI